MLEDDLALGETIQAAPLRLSCGLTWLESARALVRGRQSGRLSRARQDSAAGVLLALESQSGLVALDASLLGSARRAFPHEPVRALDALHLAAALAWREELGPIAIASTDALLRRNAAALGFALVPA